MKNLLRFLVRKSSLQRPCSYFRRIIPSFMCQGRDFNNRNGSCSIFGQKFSDENLL